MSSVTAQSCCPRSEWEVCVLEQYGVQKALSFIVMFSSRENSVTADSHIKQDLQQLLKNFCAHRTKCPDPLLNLQYRIWLRNTHAWPRVPIPLNGIRNRSITCTISKTSPLFAL